MGCDGCKKQIKKVEMQLQEDISVITDGEELSLNISSCNVDYAVNTNYINGTKTDIIYYDIIIKNYSKLDKIIGDIKSIKINNIQYNNFEIIKTDKNKFKITIKN